MNEKMFNTRIIHKHDIEANWAKALNFIPKQGELIVYDVDENYNYERIKIGDGTTKINDLSFYAGSWEDLADKPFGTETVYTEIDSEITVSITNGQTPYTRVPAFKMIYDNLPDGNTYLVTWDGTDYIVEGKKPFGNEYLYNSYDEDNGVPFCVYGLRSEMPQIYVAEDGEHTISVAKIETSLKQLDEIYIPDTIARVEDIPEVPVTSVNGQTGDVVQAQADWSQNDENQLDYIKNRTHYEIPEVWTLMEFVENDKNGATTGKFRSTSYTWAIDKYYRVRVDGVEYTFDGMIGKNTNVWVNTVYYIGAEYFALNSNMDFTTYPFCVLTADFTNIYVVFEDGTTEHTVEFFVSEGEVHQLDHKYIPNSDWNQNDPNGAGYIANRTHYDNEIFVSKTREEIYTIITDFIGGPINSTMTTIEGLTFRVVADDIIYDNVPVHVGCYVAGGTTWVIGDKYSANNFYTTDYGFAYSGYGYITNLEKFPNGIENIEVYTVEQELKQLDPKYIKDMYYEEENLIDIAGIEYVVIPETIGNGSNYSHDYIPLEMGQTYNVYRNNSVLYGSYEVKVNTDGICYIGSVDKTDPPFCITPTVTYIDSNWVSMVGVTNLKIVGVSGTYTGEPIVHQLNPKYIKDMYYEKPVKLFEVENAEFVDNSEYICEPGFPIVDGNTYIVNWDDAEYTCEAYVFEGIPAIGNTSEFGGKGKGEPFYVGYNSIEDITFVGNLDELTTHTFSVTEIVCNTIPPKYIKDMYYDNGVTVTEVVPETTVEGFAVMQEPIYGVPADINMTPVIGATYTVVWDGVSYEAVCKYPDSAEVPPIPYIGNENYLFMTSGGDFPFAIIFDIGGGVTFLATESTASSHTISVTENIHDLKQLDIKYLPILEETIETIFEADSVVNNSEFVGSKYKKLLGEYTVTVDGISQTVEFIDSDGYSFAEGSSFYIETWNSGSDSEGTWDAGIYFEFSDDEPHSVKIEEIKNIIKEEHLPDSVKTQPDWNQIDPNGAGYIKNRTHYDVETLTLLREERTVECTEPEDEYYKGRMYAYMLGGWTRFIGKTIRVIFNGTPYDILVKHGDSLGNLDIYPFLLWYDSQESIYLYVKEAGTYTLELYLLERDFKQLDPKYIKDMYYEKGVIASLSDGDSFNWEKDKPYTLRVDGIVYEFDSMYMGDYHNASGNYIWSLGATPRVSGTSINVKIWDYPFSVYAVGYGEPKPTTALKFEDGTFNHTVEVLEDYELHQIEPKYIPNSDWNQNDPNGTGYIANRTHYELPTHYIGTLKFTATSANTMEYTYTDTEYDTFSYLYYNTPEKGEIVGAVVDGVSCMCNIGIVANGWLPFNGDLSGQIKQSSSSTDTITINTDKIALITGNVYNVEFYDISTYEIHQLDEKYIPDTIARVEDIENAKEVYLAKTTQSYGRFSLVEGTFDEMRTAYSNGKVVCLLVAGVMYYASGCSAESMIFSLPPSNTIEGYDNAILMSTFIVDINNAVSHINYSLVTEEYVSNNVPKIATAEVGQTIVVKSIDENGKPTEWEAVDPWVVTSSTEGSSKKFKLTIDDSGVLTATEIVESET